jgi:hypothetical protein
LGGLIIKIMATQIPSTGSRPTKEMGNIIRVVPIDLSTGDFTDENGFFIRSDTDGVIKYCPIGNGDSEYITKNISASSIFNDPEVIRKVFRLVTTPDTELYAGYGV